LVAVSTTAETLTPRAGVNYMPGDTIGKNGIIIQKSNSKSFLHTDLISDEQYYYTVWTVIKNTPPTYSIPVLANARTGIYTVETLPYEENFDDVISELPRGWKSVSGHEGWRLSGDSPPSSPNAVLLLNPGHTTGEWFYTPGFDLNSTYKYMITFRYRNEYPGIKESLYLQGGTYRKDGLGLYNLFSAADFSLKEYAIFKSVFKPSSNAIHYFGFKTGTSGQGVLIDNFRIEKVPIMTKQHSNPEEFYPNPTTGKITVPANRYTIISVIRTDGTKIFETSIESMQELDLSPLGKGIFLIRFEDMEKSVTRKIIIL
jgi:hypothetical protein